MNHTDPIAAFRAWYNENEQWLVTQPFTEFIAVAAWKAGRAQALEDASQTCEKVSADGVMLGGEDAHALVCAAAIRALL